jgi:hypothetical protein
MSANNPTGMGDVTAMRFRKVARDIQMFNQSNQEDKYFRQQYRHHSNSADRPSSSASVFGRFINNLFR